jgi:hypothetical protein
MIAPVAIATHFGRRLDTPNLGGGLATPYLGRERGPGHRERTEDDRNDRDKHTPLRHSPTPSIEVDPLDQEMRDRREVSLWAL